MQDRRVKVIISDFHVGEGHQMGIYNNYDDFYFDDEFTEFLEYYSSGVYENTELELIINGDFFDLLKVRYEGKFSEHITLKVALAKLKQCIEGHPKVIEALRTSIAYDNHTMTYIPGNHDIDFMFPEAWASI
jgi:UDP-2,3-diacylglucosamine pyrophosphatase LpxH